MGRKKSEDNDVSMFSGLTLEAITFDDFYTLRYPVEEGEDIIYPILKALKQQGLDINDEEFLKRYFKEDELYRRKLEETLSESLLDDIVKNALVLCVYEPRTASTVVKKAVDYGLATRKTRRRLQLSANFPNQEPTHSFSATNLSTSTLSTL